MLREATSTQEDVTLIGAVGLPGGGYSQLEGRILRHFVVIGFAEYSESSLASILGEGAHHRSLALFYRLKEMCPNQEWNLRHL